LTRQLESQDEAINAQTQYAEKVETMRLNFKQERIEFGAKLTLLQSVTKTALHQREGLEDEVRKLRRELKHSQQEIILAQELARCNSEAQDKALKNELKNYKTKVTELEAKLVTLQGVVDIFPDSKKEQHLKLLEREQTITQLKRKVKQLEVELDKNMEQTEIKVQSLKRRHTHRQSLLETQLRSINVENNEEELKIRQELTLELEKCESEREGYQTKISELQAQVEDLSAQLSTAEEAHTRELNVLKSNLSAAETTKVGRKSPKKHGTVEELSKKVDVMKSTIENLKREALEAKKRLNQVSQELCDCTNSKLVFVKKTALEIEKLRNVIRQLAGAQVVSFPPEIHVQDPLHLELDETSQNYSTHYRGSSNTSLSHHEDYGLPFNDEKATSFYHPTVTTHQIHSTMK